MGGAIGHRLAGAALALTCLCSAPASAHAAPIEAACAPGMALDGPIAHASERFAIPAPLIRAVIAAESGGLVHAISPKGAMGLMQLMPGTWAELRRRYALGPDPFDPCDNIFAGTAFLRELLDRYGDPGFLAAYNAGPGRYEAWLTGRPLPAETIAYVARLSGRMTDKRPPVAGRAFPDSDAWRRSDLFVRAPEPQGEEAARSGDSDPAEPRESTDARRSEPLVDSVFVPRTGVPK